MGRFDDIKDRAKNKKEDAKDRVNSAKDHAGKSIESVAGKVEDTKTKFKKPLAEPEMRKESGVVTEERYFICHRCRDELGPIEEKQWNNLLKPALSGTKAVLGAATGNPVLVVKGTMGAAQSATDASSQDDSGLVKLPHKRLKEKKSKREEGKQFLSQCPDCTNWVCMECWSPETENCLNCS